LNRLPAEKENWGKAEILERRNTIIQRALDIWNYTVTTYEPDNDNQELVIFDETQTFNNVKIKGYTFMDNRYMENIHD